MIFLYIIGILLLSIISLIILILSIKVRIFAEYSEVDTRVQLQWLFIKIPIYPSEKKPEKVEEIPEEEEPQPEEEEPEQPKEASDRSLLKEIYNSQGVDGLISIAKRVVDYIGTFLGRLMRSLVIDEFYVDVKCAKNDAAETALYYGEVCSVLFPLLGALVSQCKVRKYDINVYPDYLARHSSASFAVNIHLYPIYVITIIFALLFDLVFKVIIGFVVKLAIQLSKKDKNHQNSDKKESVENKN